MRGVTFVPSVAAAPGAFTLRLLAARAVERMAAAGNQPGVEAAMLRRREVARVDRLRELGQTVVSVRAVARRRHRALGDLGRTLDGDAAQFRVACTHYNTYPPGIRPWLDPLDIVRIEMRRFSPAFLTLAGAASSTEFATGTAALAQADRGAMVGRLVKAGVPAELFEW